MVLIVPHPVVSFVCRQRPTEGDPHGYGLEPSDNNPALYFDIPATIIEIIQATGPTILLLSVMSYRPFVATAVQFNPALPLYDTFKFRGPTLLQESFTLNPPSVAAGAQAPLGTWTVNGCAPGDRVLPAVDTDLQGMQLTGYCSAANTVKTVLRNGTAAAIDLPACTLNLDVWRAP